MARRRNTKAFFVSEDDMNAVAYLVDSKIKEPKTMKKILAKMDKNRSFSMKLEIPELHGYGMLPTIKLRYEKIVGEDRYDLNVDFTKRNDIVTEEYFDIV